MDYKRVAPQRTDAPRVPYVNPSRSQLDAVRRQPSMTFVCLFHETTRKSKRNSQRHKPTDSHDT